MKHFWLEWGLVKIGLEPGSVVVGRGTTADLIVNDALVSRQHARLRIGADGVTIEDLKSANGVLVNKKRIDCATTLTVDDEVRIGPVDFVLKAEDLNFANGSSLTPATMPGACGTMRLTPSVSPREGEGTGSFHLIDILGALADKVLALGRGEEAERILATSLLVVLRQVHSGQAAQLPPHVFPKSAHYAIRLADATARARWVDYTIDLFSTLARPLPAEVVEQLHSTVRRVPHIDLPRLAAYVETLRRVPNLTPAERFLFQRIEGLRSVAAAAGCT